MDKKKTIGNDLVMERPKTYVATIDVIFDVWDDEKPRAVARRMANHFNGMRGANLYSDGVLRRLEKWSAKKTLKSLPDSSLLG